MMGEAHTFHYEFVILLCKLPQSLLLEEKVPRRGG